MRARLSNIDALRPTAFEKRRSACAILTESRNRWRCRFRAADPRPRRGSAGVSRYYGAFARRAPGRSYRRTFIDTYSKVAFAKLYDRKTPITAADLLNDRVVPFFDEKEVKLSRVLTDRGTEYCGNPEASRIRALSGVEDIDHSRTKTKSPLTNGICERSHKTVLNEFYRLAFRKKLHASIEDLQIEDLQNDLDLWVRSYNEERPHQGRWCFGKTPMQTFLDGLPRAAICRSRRL
jgi:transposase InsO family protein